MNRFLLALLTGSIGTLPVLNPFPIGARRWSNAAGWGGAAPSAGDSFTITDAVILDVHTPAFGDVTFSGPSAGFYWDGSVSGGVSFTAHSLVGMGGPTFQCGRPGVPFPQNGSFMELNGVQQAGTAREGGFGSTDDGVSRGFMWDGPVTVEAQGPQKLWTKLNGPINPGDTFFPTADNVTDWHVGARVAVAPSGFYDPGGNETKIFTIKSITSSGIEFNEPAAYRYWGRLQYPWDAPDGTSGISLTPGLPFTRKAHANTQTVIDQRAEMCLLSDGHSLEWRAPNDAEWNTVIAAATSTSQAYTKQHGIHTMFMRGAVQKIRGVVVRRGGQAGRNGRYPIHSHMTSYETTSHVVTIDTTSGNTVHWVGHGLPAGQPVQLTTTGKLLNGLQPSDLPNPEAKLYVLTAGLTSDSFRLGLWGGDTGANDPRFNLGASPVAASGTQSGAHGATVTLYTHDVVGEYWDRVRVDESGNRFGSIHGTCGLTISNCIGIDCKGAGWFQEDGSELRLVFRDNIGGKVRQPAPGFVLRDFDGTGRNFSEDLRGSSAFWLSHPDITFVRNRGFDANRNGVHNAFSTLVNGTSSLVRLDVLAQFKNPTQYQDNVFHSNGVNMAETPNGSGNRFGILDRAQYPGEYLYGDTLRDLPANMPLWERTFGYKNSANGYNHSVPAPHIRGFVTVDNNSLDFIGGTNPSGLIEQCLCIAYSLNDIGGTQPYSPQNDSDYQRHYAMTSYHGLVQMKDNTYVNFLWQAGHLHRQFDSGGGALSSRDTYLMGVFANPQDWTNNAFVNSHGGYLSMSPYYTSEGAKNNGDMVTTTLAANAVPGATSITLTSVANCGASSVIGVTLNNGDTWYLRTTGVVGNVVSLSGPLPMAAASGNNVRTTLSTGEGVLRGYTIASVISNATGIYGPKTEALGGGKNYVLNRPFFVSGIGGSPKSPRMATSGENGVLTDKGYSAVGGSAGQFQAVNAVRAERLNPADITQSIAFTFIESGYESYLFNSFHYVPFPDGSHIRFTHPGRVPQGSGLNGCQDFYHTDIQSSDRPDCDFSFELPWDAQAVPNPSKVFKVRDAQTDTFGKYDEYVANPGSPPIIRVMSSLNLAPLGGSPTRQQIVNALRSDTYNALADKYWVDTAGQCIVMRHRGYNADGATRNLSWTQTTLITTQDYRERNVAVWIRK